MQKAEKVYKYKGHKIKIYYDEAGMSPHHLENDNIFLVYDHRSFNVDVDGYKPIDIFNHLKAKHRLERLKTNVIDKGFELNEDHKELQDECNENINSDFDNYFIYNVYAYIHSGVSLSLNNSSYPFNDRFDVSTTGFVLVSKAEFDDNEEKAKKAAESLIKEWNDYLSSSVYFYHIFEGKKIIHSCGGFYGDEFKTNGLLEDAKGIIDANVRKIERCNQIMHL